MDEFKLFAADELREFTTALEIKPSPHRCAIQRCLLVLPGVGKQRGLHAGKTHIEPAGGQLLGQQILHPLGPRIVLTIDDVQNAARGDPRPRRGHNHWHAYGRYIRSS